jgi:soluble lytic murein transglycosylase-like protein
LFFLCFCFGFNAIYKNKKTAYPVCIAYLTRNSINEKIGMNKELYINLYGERFGNEEAVKYIIEYSLEQGVPVNLSFSLALAESNFNNQTPPNKNKDGSIDYGIFRLNSKYYPNIKKYSNLQNNIKEGISHLKKEYLKYGSYDLAIMTYNCGSPTNIGAISIQHLNNVLAFEKKLDEWFNYKYWNKINRYTN